MDILKRFGSFFFLMAESLPDESEKTIDSEDENVKDLFSCCLSQWSRSLQRWCSGECKDDKEGEQEASECCTRPSPWQAGKRQTL